MVILKGKSDLNEVQEHHAFSRISNLLFLKEVTLPQRLLEANSLLISLRRFELGSKTNIYNNIDSHACKNTDVSLHLLRRSLKPSIITLLIFNGFVRFVLRY